MRAKIRAALVGLAAVAVLSLPVPAKAQAPYPGRRVDVSRGGGDWGRPSEGWSFGYFGQYGSYYNPLLGLGGYYGCWRTARVETPAGPRVYREWVCYGD